METLSDLKHNLRAVEHFEPLAPADWRRVLNVLKEFAAIGDRFCTGCRYCVPCPNKVWIPEIFQLLNYARIYGLRQAATKEYRNLPAHVRADACVECGDCEPKCPEKIPIIDQLKEAADLFAQEQTQPASD